MDELERLAKLEERVDGLCEDVEKQGGTLDHLINTVDTILLPGNANHAVKLEEHEAMTKAAHNYIVSQKGAWAFIQKAAIILAALTGTATFVMKLSGR